MLNVVQRVLKGKWQYIFLFYHLKELLRPYIILFYRFFISCSIDRKERNVRHLHFLWICMSRQNRGHAIFLSRQPLIVLHSKLYSVCPSKYQDHSKPLKHLPINIWSATNTFIWLIPVVTSPKLPLMRSKMYPRWRTSHYFK